MIICNTYKIRIVKQHIYTLHKLVDHSVTFNYKIMFGHIMYIEIYIYLQ